MSDLNTNTSQENQEKYYRICRSYPVPPITRRCRWTKIVDAMRVGDSVLVKTYYEKGMIWKALKVRGFACETRKTTKGYRCWKVERTEREVCANG